MDTNTLHNNFHPNLKHSTSNTRLELGALVAEEVDQAILATRMAAQEEQEDGGSSQEEADVGDHSDQEVQVSPAPLAALEVQEDQEESEVEQAGAAAVDPVTPRALEQAKT